MGDVQAGARPVFDFDGSLDVAARMYQLAASLETMGKVRHEDWRAALDVWEGNVGDHVRSLIADDEADLNNVAAVLEAEAMQWADLWAQMVDETNRVLAAEAREVLKKHRDDADRGFQWHDLDDPFDSGEKERSASFDVPAAEPVGTPRPDGFGPPRSPFANYRLVGDAMVMAGYQDSPPPY